MGLASSSKLVASGSSDETVQLWQADSLVNVKVLRGHTASVNTVVFMGEEVLFSGGSDGCIKMWDLNSMNCSKSIEAHDNWVPTSDTVDCCD